MARTRCCSSTDYQSVGMACMHGKIIFRSSVIIAAGCCVCSVASERGHLFPFRSIRLFAGCGISIYSMQHVQITRMLSPCLPMRERSNVPSITFFFDTFPFDHLNGVAQLAPSGLSDHYYSYGCMDLILLPSMQLPTACIACVSRSGVCMQSSVASGVC